MDDPIACETSNNGIYRAGGQYLSIQYESFDNTALDFAKSTLGSDTITEEIDINDRIFVGCFCPTASQYSHRQNERFPNYYGSIMIVQKYSNEIAQLFHDLIYTNQAKITFTM